MARKMWFLSLLLIFVISLGVFTLKSFGKEQYRDQTDVSMISEKIEKVLRNQQDIIVRLEDIRQQQDIIRIRASRR